MRFIVRPGTDPVATADATLLKTLGLPYGGTVAVGKTHVLVKAGTVPEPTALLLGPQAQRNAGVSAGTSVDVTRAVLAPAAVVVLDQQDTPDDPGRLAAAWQGRPVSSGDHIDVPDGGEARIAEVVPNGAGTVGPATRVVGLADRASTAVPPETNTKTPAEAGRASGSRERMTSDAALLAGLQSQRELLAGWLTLLTSPDDLPATWGLPRVAGVWVEGPPGCGRPELVRAAADDVPVPLHDVALDRIFKPERLLDVLQGALAKAGDRGVILVDRVELLTGDDALSNYRTQFGAVFRWFLDSVAERRGLAVVLGASSLGTVDPGLATNPLLPRSLSIPPPDMERRKLLFEAALADVPVTDVDYATLAARSAGFSGSDIVGAVLHASAGLARRGGTLTTADILEAVRETTPSLGSTSIGEIPSHGFDQVADLVEVKQRLTEAVIWPISQPERFRALGIDPPRGILLHGPPGTGKTFVVKAVAHEAGAAFFPIKGAELLDKYVGESERGVRDVFARARTAAPSIVFFDELDALAPVRGRSTTSVTDSVVAALLTELDGVTERGDVAVIGATNRPDLIDPALLRSGRFETHIELGLPDVTARRAMLDITDVPFADDVDLDELADMTEGLSFADLEGMLREAALTALRRDTSAREVTLADIQAAKDRFL
ncbi:MAG TPA: ATP-binding protein [Acidimicrobiia bacterium]|nr:ATP-binding protein [Acidimicrobiia bacterium]